MCQEYRLISGAAIFGSQVGVELYSIVQNSIEKNKSVGRINSCTGNPKMDISPPKLHSAEANMNINK